MADQQEMEVVITEDVPDLRMKKGDKWTLVGIKNGETGQIAILKNETGRASVPAHLTRPANKQFAEDRRSAIAAAAEDAEDNFQDVKARIKQSIKKSTSRDRYPFEETETEYIDRRMKAGIVQYERGIAEQKKVVDKMTARVGQWRRAREESTLLGWTKRLADMKNNDPRVREGYLRDYQKTIKKAISTGREVPETIIAQRPEYRKAADARARYEKGRHTSFANRSIAINDTMQATRGYKVKRQDGKAITDHQVAEIALGVEEVEGVLGRLFDVFDHTDITIAHTSGKHPFLDSAGGLYSNKERTITMGVKALLGSKEVRALGHELAHWLDYESGAAEGVKTTARTTNRSFTVTAASEDYRQDELQALVKEARYSMSDRYEATKYFKKDAAKGLSEAEKADVEHVKVHLGHYWNRPREIFARLVEQYIATKRGQGGIATEAPYYYERTPGYWDKKTFAKLMPQVERIILTRIKILRKVVKKPIEDVVVEAAVAESNAWAQRQAEARKVTPEEYGKAAYISGLAVNRSAQDQMYVDGYVKDNTDEDMMKSRIKWITGWKAEEAKTEKGGTVVEKEEAYYQHEGMKAPEGIHKEKSYGRGVAAYEAKGQEWPKYVIHGGGYGETSYSVIRHTESKGLNNRWQGDETTVMKNVPQNIAEKYIYHKLQPTKHRPPKMKGTPKDQRFILQLKKKPDTKLGLRDALAKYGQPGKGFEVGDSRPPLVYRAQENNVLSDGFLLIHDKEVTDKIINNYFEKETRQAIRYQKLIGKSEAEARKIAAASIEANKKDSGKFPDWKQLIPKETDADWHYVGTSMLNQDSNNTGEDQLAWFKSGAKFVAVDMDSLAFIYKHVDGIAKITGGYSRAGSGSNEDLNGSVLNLVDKKGKMRALLMPMYVAEVPKEIRNKGAEVSAKHAPKTLPGSNRPISTLTPYEFGKRGFSSGIKAAAVDKEFLDTHIKDKKVGEGTALAEYVRGWSAAHVASTYVDIGRQPTEAELKDIHEARSRRSKLNDEARRNAIEIEPDSKRVKTWAKSPGRMDVKGIDTPTKKKTKAARPAARQKTKVG